MPATIHNKCAPTLPFPCKSKDKSDWWSHACFSGLTVTRGWQLCELWQWQALDITDGQVTECWLRHPELRQSDGEEVLSGKPHCWHSSLASGALDCPILASSCRILSALHPATTLLGAQFLFPSWYTLNFHFLNKSFKSQCFVIRAM